jgi:hypothetical protein
VRIRNFNIASLPRSNFKPWHDINRYTAVIHIPPSIDITNVSADVDIALVALGERGVSCEAVRLTCGDYDL